jgi:hypothetical protein
MKDIHQSPKRKDNNLGKGFAIGMGIGFLTKDIAVWLSVGIGSGMAFGPGNSAVLDKHNNK